MGGFVVQVSPVDIETAVLTDRYHADSVKARWSQLFTVNSWVVATAVLTVWYGGWAWQRNGRFADCLLLAACGLLNFS